MPDKMFMVEGNFPGNYYFLQEQDRKKGVINKKSTLINSVVIVTSSITFSLNLLKLKEKIETQLPSTYT